MTVEMAKARPVRTALSGPAAGVIAAAHIATSAGFPNVVTGDVGGTSFDVSLIADGETALAAQTAIDFGLVVRTPMIEITTIGAGGGSIASVDRGGLVAGRSGVGRRRAGSGLLRPGQRAADADRCQCRARTHQCRTADRRRADAARCRGGEARHRAPVGEPLGLDAVAAAEAIVRVANSRMAGAIRLVSIERGHNPRDFALMPFGGGGALHAGALMKEVGLKAALVPPYPGVTSALGCVIADMRHDFVQTVNRTLDGDRYRGVQRRDRRMAEQGARLLDRSGVAFIARDTLVACDMLYLGQTHTVVGAGRVAAGRRARCGDDTRRLSSGAIARSMAGCSTAFRSACSTFTSRLIGRRPKLDLAKLAPPAAASRRPGRACGRSMSAAGWREATIYARRELPVGAAIAGPAILEQQDATIFVEPDLQARVDRFGNVILERHAP